MKLWIDTDIGGDIDDALALLLAMANRAEIAGVSTVFGNTKARARIASTLLRLGGYGTSVYAGEELPLAARRVFHDDVCPHTPPATYLPEFDGEKICCGAVEGLARALQKEKLTIVTLGALTNLAKLLREYPEAAKNIEALYIMGTAVEWNVNEFNITCDPEAADIVLSSEVEKHVVSLDVTFRCALSKEQIARLSSCKSRCVKTVISMSKLWGGEMILHDPLALACAIGGKFVEFRKGNLKVELEGKFSRGKCVNLCDFNWRYPARDDLFVSVGVQSEDFTAYYVDKICELDRALQSKENKEEIV